MDDPQLSERIIALLADKRGIRPERIKKTSCLLEDLGMDGDDAAEFFEKYGNQFGVDLKNMQWNRHFGPEGCNPFAVFTPSFWKWRRTHRAIRVEDLILAAKVGKWNFDYEK